MVIRLDPGADQRAGAPSEVMALTRTLNIADIRRTTQDGRGAVSYRDAMRHGGVFTLEADTTAVPDLAAQLPFAKGTHSAVFAEVKVDPDFGTVEVSRVVSAIAAGRNPEVAGDSYLEVGPMIADLSMTLHACSAFITGAQRTRWSAYAEQTVWNIWNYNSARWGTRSAPTG